MNRQSVFETAIKAVIEQGGPSFIVRPHAINESLKISCRYRQERNNRKCALGHLIKDEYYKPTLEGQGPYDPNVMDAIKSSLPDLEVTSIEFFNSLQGIHDQSIGYNTEITDQEFMTRFKVRALEFAAAHELDSAFIK